MREGRAFFAGDRNADAAGRASFEGLPRGPVWVLGYGAGRARASSQAVLEAGSRELRLVLRPARALDVVVVDESEHPVEGASLEVTTTDPLPYAAVTAKDGAAASIASAHRPTASAPGRRATTRSSAPASSRRHAPAHPPGAAAALAVTVVLADGRPAAGATVLAAGTGLWPARSTTTDAEGAARLGGLHGGVYDLKARLGAEVSRTELAVAVQRGEVKEVKLTLGPGKRVRVTVTDGDGDAAPPVKDADVVLVEEGLSSFPCRGGPAPMGRSSSGPSPPAAPASRCGRRASWPGRRWSPRPRPRSGVGLVRGGVLAGDVVDDRGYPVAGATVEIVGVDAEGMPIDETSAMIDFRDERFEVALAGPAPLIPMGELGVMPGPIPSCPTPRRPPSPPPRPARPPSHAVAPTPG